MGAKTNGQDEAERHRDYFEVQIRFAETLAGREGSTLSDAYLRYTNLHRRFGFGKIEAGEPAAGWRRYAAGLQARTDAGDRLDWTLSVFAEATPAVSGHRQFGCFSCEAPDRDGVVRIHFSNRDGEDAVGPLARVRIDRRMAELREMFGFIGAAYPHARTVRGGSWLYNIDAYRRLFPPAYAASARPPGPVRLDGSSSWGQVLDFRGRVKPEVRSALLGAALTVDLDEPWAAFPWPALAAECPIEAFYAHYGV